MAISTCCDLTRAKIKRAAFFSNAMSVCAKICWVCHLRVYLELLRANSEKNTGNHGND